MNSYATSIRALGALACTLAMISATSPAGAATGIAWDQVTKFVMDGSVPQPNFPADFRTASQPQAPAAQRGGLFGGALAAAMGAGGAMAAFQNGIAERDFVAGPLRRVDNVAAQTSTIVDCSARTVTTLDLAKKTYHVESMDKPATAGPARSGPSTSAPAQDDGTRIKVAYTSQALGPKQIDAVNTDGYHATMTVTTTRPNGDSQNFSTDITAYYSGFVEPRQSCPSALFAVSGAPSGPGPMAALGAMSGMIGQMANAMRSSGDSRYTFTSTGPALPSGKIELFMASQLQGQQGQGRALTIVTERGNVHPVDDGDKSVFGVPPDFTKV